MHDRSPPTLRDMVKTARASKNLTLRQLAKRAVDPETGQTASFSLLHDIETGNVKRMPYVAHLRAIAVALDQPFETVRQAAIAEYLPAQIDTDAIREQAEQLEAEAARLHEIIERQNAAEGNPGRRESA